MKDTLEFLRGAVRPLVTFAVVAAWIAAVFIGLVPLDMGIVGAIIGFWFGSRPQKGDAA